jgi:hypothetical protein
MVSPTKSNSFWSIVSLLMVVCVLLVQSKTHGQDTVRYLKCFKNQVNGQTQTFQLFETPLKFDPKSSVLVVIDLWMNVAPLQYMENTKQLILLARRQHIPVIFISHENPLWSEVTIEPGDIVLDGYKTVLENYFHNNSMDVKTILFAGYNSAECLTITRKNSISRVSWRSDNYQIITVKDCIWSGHWYFKWSLNSLETRFHTTTLQNLSDFFGSDEAGRSRPFDIDDYFKIKNPVFTNPEYERYKKKYRHLDPQFETQRSEHGRQQHELNIYQYDKIFGDSINWTEHALVIINPDTNISDRTWRRRAAINNNEHISPFLNYVRQKGLQICFFANGDMTSDFFELAEGEKVFQNCDSLFSYLGSAGTKKIIYTGNISNQSRFFSPLDAWKFTIFNGGFNAVFLQDCLITEEIETSLEKEIFKEIFLERATFDKPGFTVSNTSLFIANQGGLVINEIYRDTISRTGYVELFNKSPLIIDLGDFSLSVGGVAVPLPSIELSPGQYFVVQYSDSVDQSHDLSIRLDYDEMSAHQTAVILSNLNTGRIVEYLQIPISSKALGRFPDGGINFLSYNRPSPYKSNYYLSVNKKFCEGDQDVTVSTLDAAGLMCEWYFNDTSILNNVSANQAVLDSGTYKVIIRYEDLEREFSTHIAKLPLPEAHFELMGDLDFCSANPPLLSVVNSNDVEKYYWMKGDELLQTGTEYNVKTDGDYHLVVKGANGCFNRSEPIKLQMLSGNSFACNSEPLTTSPNPSSGNFTVNLKSWIDLKSITILNTMGTEVHHVNRTFKPNNHPKISSSAVYEIDLDLALPEGVYIVIFNAVDQKFVHKILIHH